MALCLEYQKCYDFMYQMKLSRFADFSGNMYVFYDIAYQILELDNEKINFKNSKTAICS